VAPLAQIVDVGDLLNVVFASLLAGVGVCVVFSLVIVGFARAVDMRRDGRSAAAAAYFVLMAVAFAAVLALAAFGIAVMASK
jgi:cation transporter-like permease